LAVDAERKALRYFGQIDFAHISNSMSGTQCQNLSASAR
jgi:hypothetical protein